MEGKCISFVFCILMLGTALSQHISSLTVYIFPPASTNLYVCCWSNSTSAPFNEGKEFNETKEISWTINSVRGTPSYYDAYYCRARMGSNLLVRFPLYGDGMDRLSSEWIVNSRGRRRLSANGRMTDDFRGSWVVT